MMDYIIQFPEQIKAGLKIAEGTTLKACDRKIENLIICGLGGSGIGGKIVSRLCRYDINIPVTAHYVNGLFQSKIFSEINTICISCSTGKAFCGVD